MTQEQMVVTVCVGLVCICGLIGIWANWRPSNPTHRRIHTSMYTAPVVTPWDPPLPPRIDWDKVDQLTKQGSAETQKAVPVDPFNL
jgi:hypothetical protein